MMRSESVTIPKGFSVDAHTALVGVMGWPVEHSLSPAMHNVAIRKLGLNWCYVALPVRPESVSTAVKGLAALHFRGCNVTVPHKRTVMSDLSTIDPDARALGAVNTLVFSYEDGDAHIDGFNTDVAGFLGALRQRQFDPQGKNTVIAGAGGAARGVAYALLSAGAQRVMVLNRTPARAETMVGDMADPRIAAGGLTPESLIETVRKADLLVNATTLGMWPHVEGSIWPANVPVPAHITVYDLVYNPLETRLLRQTRQAGALGIDGLGMLAQQGALALDLWTQQDLDVDEVAKWMREECRQALAGRA
ncbi:MAG: shikimate dehydrogenase [Anaerolineae bacterium]|nr:shikimate dehydrogenase [Anaerolineae bacterium]